MATPEGRVTESIVRYLKKMKASGEPLHWRKKIGIATGFTGEPDLDICFHGRTVKLEIKAGKNVASPLQEQRLSEWKKAGAVVGTVYAVEDVIDALNEVRGELVL